MTGRAARLEEGAEVKNRTRVDVGGMMMSA